MRRFGQGSRGRVRLPGPNLLRVRSRLQTTGVTEVTSPSRCPGQKHQGARPRSLDGSVRRWKTAGEEDRGGSQKMDFPLLPTQMSFDLRLSFHDTRVKKLERGP